ncbi:Protein of unknown function [Propionibacterium freudenreichii]|jgi:tetratricopeptide (TPR) repeat protein
MTPL